MVIEDKWFAVSLILVKRVSWVGKSFLQSRN